MTVMGCPSSTANREIMMHHSRTNQRDARRTRSAKPTPNSYLVDDVAFRLSDIKHARSDHSAPAAIG